MGRISQGVVLCFLTLAVVGHAHASSVSSATPSPTSANQTAQYTVVFVTGNGNTNLDAGVGTITLTFNDSTFVPASISAANVTINGNGVTTVSVSGRAVTITTPVTIAKNGGTATVVISASAGIRNPGIATTYYLRAQSSAEPANVYSPGYTITASTTLVTGITVSPNPSVESLSAAYTVSFNTGAGGYLTANTSTIKIKLANNTTIPGGSISGVTMNGAAASASSSSDTITITVPTDVGNSSGVTVSFASGSGIVNPTSGSKTAMVKTSSETTYQTSAAYNISSAAQLSVSAVTLGTNIANATSSYTIDFVVSNPNGALTANTDTLYVTFDDTTTVVPATISTANVTVTSGGFSDNPPTVVVSGRQVSVITPVAVANGATVSLIFSSGANIRNPAKAGSATILLETSQNEEVPSNPFTITAATSTVTQSTVVLSNTAATTNSNYTFSFSVGQYGRMISATDSFMVTFPAGTAYGSLGATGTVNGVSATQRRVGATNVVSVIVPGSVSIDNSSAVTLVVNTATNPGNGTYSASIRTSVETGDVTTQSYVIGGTAATLSSVVPGTPGVNQTSAYTFNATGITNLSANNLDYVRVTFPEGTTLPATIAVGNVSFAGGTGQSVSSVTVNTSARQVDVYVGTNNRTFASLTFSAAAGIVNPSVPSTTYYTGRLLTTQQTQPATSPAYTISKNNTSVTAGTVTATPNVVSQPAAYQVVFTTTANGKIVGGTSAGSDSIWVQFLNGGTDVPPSITAATVSVNATSCTGVSVLQSGANGTVRIAIPSGLTLAASTQHTVTFSSSSGLTNGGSAGNYTVRVATSADSAYSTQTANLAIASAAELTVTQSTVAPSTVNASAARTIKFTTGSLSSDTLAIGDTIRVVFPSNTSVPSSVSNSLITVNGANIPSNATGIGTTLRFRSPVIVGMLTNVTVAISSSAGILNPTLVATNYVDSVKTRQTGSGLITGPKASPQYSTAATITTVSTPTVLLNTYTPSTSGRDSIRFTTGSNGRLLAGTSTIVVTFPSGTTVPASPTTRVNGVTASASGSGTVLTITVPASVSISNNGVVEIGVDGITNPVAGNYTLSVNTSVETSSVSSSSYAISNVPAVSGITVSLLSSPNPTDTVNMAGRYSIRFTLDGTQGALTAGSGTITITFPSNTAVPASITDSVQVNGTNATLVSPNSGTRQVVITTPVTIANGGTASIVFGTSTNIVNPSIAQTYALQIRTSSQPTPATSPNYTIGATSTTLTNVVINVTPSEPSQIGRYTFTFNTGLRGKMVSGTSRIYLLFPFDATFTTGLPSTSTVTVNGVAADALQLNETTLQEDTLIVTVPTSVTIGNQTAITVIVDSTAGVQNASSASQLSYKVFTSVETGIASGDYTLPVQLSRFEVASSGKLVILSWTTESEINNAYWVVEKAVVPSEDEVALNKLNFTRIKALEGQGTKTSSTNYVHEDEEVESGLTYVYRLLDVSHDGTITPHELRKIKVDVPQEFSLFQNYPNPFNPSTTIGFSLPVASRVTVKVYNLLGQEVADVTNRVLPAGLHKEVWNGLNTRGERVASGIYIYRITAVGVDGQLKFQKSREMMLIK